MKIALGRLDAAVGDFQNRFQRLCETIDAAVMAGAEMIVFPELAACGPGAADYFLSEDFIRACEELPRKLAGRYESTDIGIIIGTPVVDLDEEEDAQLLNAAICLYQGELLTVACKAVLLNEDVHNDTRYFRPGLPAQFSFKGKQIFLTVGPPAPHADEPDLQSPLDLVIWIEACPFHREIDEERKEQLDKWGKILNAPIVYVNHEGTQDELIFEGCSMLQHKDLQRINYPILNNNFSICDPFSPADAANVNDSRPSIARVYDALIAALRSYFTKVNSPRAILGMSGGVDSALVLALAARALGCGRVLPVLMPSPYSSEGSVTDSLDMIDRLSCSYLKMPIAGGMYFIDKIYMDAFGQPTEGLTAENIQSRMRGLLLMAISNSHGGILLNTGNKSEIALGYSTLYGDSIGALCVIGDLYKTEVYELCHYINTHVAPIIPENILTKAPSAELRPDQKDTDSLPQYDILDPILRAYIEKGLSPSQIIAGGADAETVHRIVGMMNRVEFKRFQAPPILRVSKKAFGRGRQMPILSVNPEAI